MSLTNPAKSDIASGMTAIAETLAAKAADLMTFAQSVKDMDEAEFMEMLGSEYGGPGFFRQMDEAVDKASEIRPSDTFAFRHSLTAVYAKAQRASASQS